MFSGTTDDDEETELKREDSQSSLDLSLHETPTHVDSDNSRWERDWGTKRKKKHRIKTKQKKNIYDL